MPHARPISLRLRAMFGLLDAPADPPPPRALLEAAADLDRSLLPGQLALITGPSGAGKSTLARALHALSEPEAAASTLGADALPPSSRAGSAERGENRVSGYHIYPSLRGACDCHAPARRYESPHTASAHDPTPADLLTGPLARRLRLLASVGLADAHVFTRPLRHLSVGERARLDIATAIDRLSTRAPRPTLILDEFGSTLDRPAAFRLCRLLRRWLARGPRARVVCITAHDDLAAHLAPNIRLHVTPAPRVRTSSNRSAHEPTAPVARLVPPSKPAPTPTSRHALSPASAPIPSLRVAAADSAPSFTSVPQSPPSCASFDIEPGSPADFRALAPHHYRAGAPAVIAGPRAIRRALDSLTGELLGVLVISMPTLNAPWRDAIWPGRYRTSDKHADARRLRDELRCIARVIVAPEHRGLGIAAALVRHYLADSLTPATEALAAMGPASPFFVRAGMRAYRLPPTTRDTRLRDCLAFLALTPASLMVDAPCPLLRRELRRWANASRATRHLLDDPHALARRAAAALLAPPTVYAHVAPTAARSLSTANHEAPDADSPHRANSSAPPGDKHKLCHNTEAPLAA